MKKIVSLLMLIVTMIGTTSCSCKKEEMPYGVWAWSNLNEIDVYAIDELVELVEDYGFNEIYFEHSLDTHTQVWVKSLKNAGVDVYHLIGEADYLLNYEALYSKIDDYVEYNRMYPNAQFKGVHLDIEPHQLTDFQTNREALILSLIELADNLNAKYPDVHFEYDIPFWLDDEITYKEVTKKAYEHMIDIADRIVVMSYRDTAETIYEVAKEELEYGKSVGKKVLLAVETQNIESDEVNFYEEGEDALESAIKSLKEKEGYNGIAIHDLNNYHLLEEKED